MMATAFAPKILILHPGALGDGLLALPSLRGLSRAFPDHHLIWVGHQPLGDLLVNAGVVHGAISFDFVHLKNVSSVNPTYERYLKSCFPSQDRIIGWMNDYDGFWRSFAKDLGYVHTTFQSPKDHSLHSTHMIDRYWEVVVGRGDSATPLISEDFRAIGTGEISSDLLTGRRKDVSNEDTFILMHPGSGSPNKCLATKVFSDLARTWMIKAPGRVAFIGGPADARFLDPLLIELDDFRPTCYRNVELSALPLIFKQTTLFIGHDSGLSHLAANLGVPSILLFGPTDPAVWAPRGRYVGVLRNEELVFSFEEVFAIAEEVWRDSPFLVGS